MLRGLFLGILILLGLSACAGEATPASPSASPSETASNTPTLTATIDYAQLTAFATYRPTFPPTFTPTYTPSATSIPSATAIPSASATRTAMPELLICPGFDESPYRPQGLVIGVTFKIPLNLTLNLEIVSVETGEVVDSAELPNRDTLVLLFDASRLPAGDYIWRASLADETRTGLCPKEGRYTLLAVPTQAATQVPATAATPAAASTLSIEGVRATATALAQSRPRDPQATNEAGN
jgi:hypothetical protein